MVPSYPSSAALHAPRRSGIDPEALSRSLSQGNIFHSPPSETGLAQVRPYCGVRLCTSTRMYCTVALFSIMSADGFEVANCVPCTEYIRTWLTNTRAVRDEVRPKNIAVRATVGSISHQAKSALGPDRRWFLIDFNSSADGAVVLQRSSYSKRNQDRDGNVTILAPPTPHDHNRTPGAVRFDIKPPSAPLRTPPSICSARRSSC